MVGPTYDRALPGFKSFVPEAFNDAVGSCAFAAGEILYNCVCGYLPWSEAVQKLSWSIQIIEAETAESGDENASKIAVPLLFEKNWLSPVTIRLTRYPSMESTTILSTQGKLYSTLWKGDLNILSQPENPASPISVANSSEFLVEAKTHFNSLDDISWLMPYDRTNQVSALKLARIKECLLASDQNAVQESISGELLSPQIAPTVEFIRFSMKGAKVEAFRDAIIKALWPSRPPGGAKKSVRSIFERERGTTAPRFSLDDHGVFSPNPRGLDADKDIWVRCFTHKTFYRYRFNRYHARASYVPKAVLRYLETIFTATPNFLFASGASLCASKMAEESNIKLDMLQAHDLIANAALSEGLELATQRHECVQKYLIEKDQRTLATEIPVWVEANEFDDYAKVFKSSLPMSGHIDILRMEENGRVGIWDYKPGSAYEAKAFNQLQFYAFMLAARTGMPISAFFCGFFDEQYAFTFKPEEHPLG